MNTIPTYTTAQLVRIELLRYDNPDGLHPIESNWRDLSRKLLEHVEYLQEQMKIHHTANILRYDFKGECPLCHIKEFKGDEFPGKFETKQRIE